MASMKRPRLKAVTALPGHRLELTFVDGSQRVVSLAVNLPGPLTAARYTALGAAVTDDGIRLEVADTGHGMTPEVMASAAYLFVPRAAYRFRTITSPSSSWISM